MSEFRQNPITKAWVLIAPKRAQKPEDFNTISVMQGQHELDPTCVFCPGMESKNKELARFPKIGDWQVRVIENKFHALENTTVYQHREFYTVRSGNGNHEVIITRKHNEPVALQSIALVEASIDTFIYRLRKYKEDPEIHYAQIFHNHGHEAGASLVHPHYQIIATPFVPPHVHTEILGCYHYHQIHQSCIYCDIITEEVKLKERVVYENDHFVVMSAFASRQPFETWILPKKHGARFEDITHEQRTHLAYVLKVTLGQLYTKLNDPPLNFYVHTLPLKSDSHTQIEEPAYHWHLTKFPRISEWAGFEYATGIAINPVPPEASATFLRGA